MRVHAAGLVIKDLPVRASNFRQTMTLAQYLQRENVVAIAGIDTRRLTRVSAHRRRPERVHRELRGGRANRTGRHRQRDRTRARRAQHGGAGPRPGGVGEASPTRGTRGEWQLGAGYGGTGAGALSRRGLRLRRQAQHPAHAGQSRLPRHRGAGADVGSRRAGVVAGRRLSQQRPGRPRAVRLRDPRHARADRQGPAHLRHLPRPPDPGVGLGGQDLQDEVRPPRRQPSGERPRQRPVSITSQNHGFAVDDKSLPATLRPTHVSLFDGTLQGLARTDRPAFCFQGHPEASPGPHDIGYLFDRFVALMEKKLTCASAPTSRAS